MKRSFRNLMLVLALSVVLWAGMIFMFPMFAGSKRVWLLLALFLVVFVGTVASFWSRRRRFAATLDGETIEKMKVQPLDQHSTKLGRIGTTLLSLPRFNIAQLMVFTLVCAVDVWAFLWDPCIGCWTTFFSQVLFWTVLRVRAVLRLERQSPPQKRREWFWGIVIISVVTSVGAVVTFFCGGHDPSGGGGIPRPESAQRSVYGGSLGPLRSGRNHRRWNLPLVDMAASPGELSSKWDFVAHHFRTCCKRAP